MIPRGGNSLETYWHVWQICRVINSLNADTATLPDQFTKIVPREFHVWFRSCQFLIYPLVWMAPFLKENQQLPDADARCIGSQMTELTLENTLHHPYKRRAQDARKHNRKKLLWELEEAKTPEWLKHAKSPSFFSRDQLKVLVRTRNDAKSFSERPFTITYESTIWPGNLF